MTTSVRSCSKCLANIPHDAAFCPRCGTPVSALDADSPSAIEPLSGALDPGSVERLQQALGETIEVRRLLGRGGFGEVFVAYDRRLKREIAVKTIRGDVVASERTLARFQREAEAIAKLRHPNIIPVFSVGEGEGLVYLTMPLIEGETLAEALARSGRLPVADGCRILREAAGALDAAHRAGIVHRDIKPENLMLEGPDRTVVVMDFGIAKSSGAEGLTGTGMLVGTLEYMSPEQASGDRQLNHASDQFSLAVVGYRMLGGRMPFEAASVQTQIFKLLSEVPPPLSSLDAGIPEDVSAAIARAMAKDPKDRFASMREFAAALAGPATGSSPVARRSYDLRTRIGWTKDTLSGVRA